MTYDVLEASVLYSSAGKDYGDNTTANTPKMLQLFAATVIY
jgi:hypothetical protein